MYMKKLGTIIAAAAIALSMLAVPAFGEESGTNQHAPFNDRFDDDNDDNDNDDDCDCDCIFDFDLDFDFDFDFDLDFGASPAFPMAVSDRS